MAEGKDDSLPIIMDHFETSSSQLSPNSAQTFSFQNLPPALQGSLNNVISECLKIQRSNEALSKEIEVLRRQVVKEKTEKEVVQKRYDDLLRRVNSQTNVQASRGPSSSSGTQTRMNHPNSLQLESDLDSRPPFISFQEEGSIQADGAIPQGWNQSLMSKGNDGIVNRGDEFVQQQLMSVLGAAEPANSSISEDETFEADNERIPQASVTTSQLEFMATGLDTYNWQTYMRALGLYDSDLEDIRYNYRDNAYEQRYQALLFWRNKNGLQASPESLITAALRRNQRLLAEKFCRKFKGYEHLLKKDPDKKKPGKTSPHGDSMKSIASESDISGSFKRLSVSVSDSSSVSSFTEEQSYISMPGDEAVPTSPPHSNLQKSSSTPSMPTVPEQLSSPFVLLVKKYMNNPNEDNQLLYQISQMPFTTEMLQRFASNLLKHHDEEKFILMVNEKTQACRTWWDVCERWAECVTSSDIARWKERPPVFLWNFFLALHSSGFARLYDKIKKFLKPGSVGPSLPHTESLSDTKWSLLNDVSGRLQQQVSGVPDWRKIAEELGCSKQIPIWEQNGNGGKNVMQVYKTRGKTVGDLYEMMFRLNRNDIVKAMEDLQYTLPI